MSLLIHESPMQVLPTLAVKIGLNQALFLQQLHYLLSHSQLKEGRRWYSSAVKSKNGGDWVTTFPFWGQRTIERIIADLRRAGLVETTSAFNAKSDDQTSWFAINYEAVEELNFEYNPKNIDKQPFRQNGGAVAPIQTENAKNTDEQPFRQNGGALQDLPEIPVNHTAKMADSFLIQELTTPPLQSPPQTAKELVMAAGLNQEWSDWRDHLNLPVEGPARRLTLGVWSTWISEGLVSELRESVMSIILMGGKAADPMALLRARMERKRGLKQASVAATVARETLNENAEKIDEGGVYLTPGGTPLTVEYVEDGMVFWVEHAPEAPIRLVLTWAKAGAA